MVIHAALGVAAVPLGRASIVPVRGSKTLRLGRRAFLMLTVAGLLPRLAQAQHPGIRHRIGWISTEPQPDPFLEGFREGLRRHGCVEGQNILLELRYAPGNIEALRSDDIPLLQWGGDG
jgi:hypothetical protein